MFTGIIKELGIVRGMQKRGGSYRLEIESKNVFKTSSVGDSISINGVCLTVVENKNGIMSFDVMDETALRSSLANLKPGNQVNLEDSVRAGGLLGGHFVLGHVDCKAKIKKIGKVSNDCLIDIEFPGTFRNLIVEKGSIAVDGISLTVGRIGKNSFTVYLIPHTLKSTTLGTKRAGDEVNVEFDIIGKYIAGSAKTESRSGITEEFLKEKWI